MKQEGGSMLEVKRHVKWMMKQRDKTKDETYRVKRSSKHVRERKMKSVQTLRVISAVHREL
jgi:hypothetical protein